MQDTWSEQRAAKELQGERRPQGYQPVWNREPHAADIAAADAHADPLEHVPWLENAGKHGWLRVDEV